MLQMIIHRSYTDIAGYLGSRSTSSTPRFTRVPHVVRYCTYLIYALLALPDKEC